MVELSRYQEVCNPTVGDHFRWSINGTSNTSQ
jgi:hypothetical protein